MDQIQIHPTVEAKNDPDFGRTSFANPLNNGPFYAIKVTAGVHGANHLGGTAVADFVVFGRIAGDSAAAYASAQ